MVEELTLLPRPLYPYEVWQAITHGDVLPSLDHATDDFRWAAAIAAFAEILKDSPYADYDNIEAIDAIIEGDPQTTWSREEFGLLYPKAKALLSL